MINLSKSGDTIVFEFVNNGHYLENGTIEVPVNSLSLVIDSSNMATFKKASSNDVFIAATYDELGMTKAELETFYKENMAGSTGGGGGATYSAGMGINIDSADTITAIYEGYPYVDEDDEYQQLIGITDPFYVKQPEDCANQKTGYGVFDCNGNSYGINFNFAEHNITSQTQDWQAYFSVAWDEDVMMFLITPLQTIEMADDWGCVRFVWPSAIILVDSGKTTSVINEVRKIADSSVKDVVLSVSDDNHVNLSYTTGDGWPEHGFMVDGGLVTSSQNNKLSTKVIASAAQKWIDITIPQYYQTIYISPTKSIQFDLTDAPGGEGFDVIVGIYFETIIKGDGSLLNDPGVDVNVTLENGHVTVTVKDGVDMYINGFSSNGNSLYDFIDNAKEYGYEYTTVDNAIETLFNDKADTSAVTESINAAVSGKQDTLSAGTGIEISGNVISATGGGGGIDSGTVQTMIDDSISGKADTSAVTESINAAVSGKVDTTDFATYSGTVETALSGKVDTSAITSSVTSASTDSQVPSAKAVHDAISAGGGSSVNVVQTTGTSTTDVMSQNAVTTAIDAVSGAIPTAYINRVQADVDSLYERFYRFSTPSNYNYFILRNAKINGRQVLNNGWSTVVNEYHLVETSAITSSVTSASTDSQVPSAKAVYDAISDGGGGGTVSSAITSGDTNAVAGGAVYDKFDEVEQVTAAALNNLSAAFDGLKLKKLTQAQYDALSPNYDNNTLYVII